MVSLTIIDPDEARREAVHVLSVLEHIASCIPASLANSLADDLLGHMRTFQAPPNVIQAMIQALAEICRYVDRAECAAQNQKQVVRELILSWRSQGQGDQREGSGTHHCLLGQATARHLRQEDRQLCAPVHQPAGPSLSFAPFYQSVGH